MDMKLYKVIKAPHITEQSSQLSQDLKQIVFKVDKGANKREIKKAVENLFNVTVVKVTKNKRIIRFIKTRTSKL
jgi:large subunit ribosomal protein L23